MGLMEVNDLQMRWAFGRLCHSEGGQEEEGADLKCGLLNLICLLRTKGTTRCACEYVQHRNGFHPLVMSGVEGALTPEQLRPPVYLQVDFF